MNKWIVLILGVLAAFFGVGGTVYATNHNVLGAVLAGLGGVATYLVKSPLS